MATLGKLRQWAGEVISSRDKSTIAEEFQELEKDIELRKDGANKLHIAAEAYHHALSKKTLNEALGDSDKLLPIDALGIVMLVHGEHFPEDSDFGTSLVKFGRAHCKAATLQEAYALTFKDTFITAIERFKEEVKEYESLRKKLESRKSALDSANTRYEKSRNSKKDKDRQEAEEELDRAQQRYDETAEDMRAHMHAIQELEITQQRELTHFLDIEINYVQQYLDVLKEVRDDWPDRNAGQGRKPQRNSVSSRSRPLMAPPIVPSASQTTVRPGADLSSDEETEDRRNGSRFIKHRKSFSVGSKPPSRPPSRPSSRLSRKRTNSNGRSKSRDRKEPPEDEEKEATERPRRFSVAGWASNAVESITAKGTKVKDKDSFATLDDEQETNDDEPSNGSHRKSGSFSLSRRLSRKKKSKESVGTTSPVVPPRILKPLSLRETKVVYAVYDFNGSVDELSFKAGTDITVLNEVVDGWWMGEINGKKGLFPTSHVSSSPPKPSLPPRPSRNGPPSAGHLLSPVPHSAGLDGGYITSDADDDFGYHQPMSHNRSPIYNAFNDVYSMTSGDEEGSPTIPQRQRRFSDDFDLPPNNVTTTPKMRSVLLSGGDSANQPLISRTTSDGPLQTQSSPTKKAPPPPPPRRMTATAPPGASPAIPERRLGPAVPPRPRGNSLAASNAHLASSSNESMSVGYDVSPFDSAAELSSSVGCGQFRQNPFQPQGMCSNCRKFHS
ncbi:cell division control protein 25 [Coprinopsis cinerea AmutBmut pab1-1]|nr:cell division control protein 25 [Coprinopsis cinerea AmutBmut pab1-1]